MSHPRDQSSLLCRFFLHHLFSHLLGEKVLSSRGQRTHIVLMFIYHLLKVLLLLEQVFLLVAVGLVFDQL